jgi:hypothetical protein
MAALRIPEASKNFEDPELKNHLPWELEIAMEIAMFLRGQSDQ